MDGLVHLKDSKSDKILWSFRSGPSLYSAYQDLPRIDGDKENASKSGEKQVMESFPKNAYYVEVGDDEKLYVISNKKRKKVEYTIEEFISSTPHISDEGIITIGSRRQTFFLVDPGTGRVINSDSLPMPDVQGINDTGMEIQSIESNTGLLYITRTDYMLQSYYSGSKRVLWNMKVAEIVASFLCPGNKLGLEYQSDFELPLSCDTKVVVPRDYMLQMGSGYNQLTNALDSHLEDERLPLPTMHNYETLSLPDKSNTQINMLENSCEVGKNCLMRYDEDFKQPGSGISEVVVWTLNPYLPLFLLGGFILLLIFNFFKGRRLVEADNNMNESGRKHLVVTKKRKTRKASNSKNGVISGGNVNSMLLKNDDVESHQVSNVQNNDSDSPTSRINDAEFGDGRWIGELFVSNIEIAKGSNGTVIYEGIQDRHRKVAVKRLLLAHNDVAFKEIEYLILSDQHPNIVRLYRVEQDVDFVYLSLERCTCSLNDLIQLHLETSLGSLFTSSPPLGPTSRYNVQVGSLKGMTKDELWNANGYPSPLLLKLMRDVVRGLAHLHDLGIVHRDLKPQNVLISQEKVLCAKISDMGISKRLLGDMSSCYHPTGYGSSGWQAPEQLQHERQTRAVDIFSLGCVLFFCITGGRHPFGERLERDSNIIKNNVDLFLVEHIPEAVDLFSRLLNPNPKMRPKANEVYHHPFFWDVGTRLAFLRDASDIIESEKGESDLLKAIEKTAPVALGCKWDEKVDAAFIENIRRRRLYNYGSVSDLLRAIRNKLNHCREDEIQKLLGPVPSGFYSYFSNRFPKLLIEVYKVMYKFCRGEERQLMSKFNKKEEEEFIQKYFAWDV